MMKNYEDDVLLAETGLKPNEDVNPFRYIDITIQRALACLNKENMESGFYQFVLLINGLEYQCRALKLLDDIYDEEIKKFLNSKEYNDEGSRGHSKLMKLANKKFGLLFEAISNSRTDTSALKIRKRDLNDDGDDN